MALTHNQTNITMTKKTKKATKQPSSQTEGQLASLTLQQAELRKIILQERAEGFPSQSELKLSIDQSDTELRALNLKLDKTKALIKKRKAEIKQWKENFDRIDKLDKSQELEQLQKEIDWRAEEIAKNEMTVAALYDTKNELTGKIEGLNIKLMIVEQGFHEKPIEQDPRLLAINEEIDELNSAIKSESQVV